MSIASDIQGTADFIAGWALHKNDIPYRTAGLLAEKLLALADQVKHLENVPLRLDSPEVRLGFHTLPDDWGALRNQGRRERHDAD